jgi:O-antigen ligase
LIDVLVNSTLRARPSRKVVTPHRANGGPEPVQDQTPASDARIVRLFCAWIFLTCFYYKALPSLRWNVGVTVTPDRLLLTLVLLVFAARLAKSRPLPKPTLAATTLERLSVLFALIGATSWYLSGADTDKDTFVELIHLSNLSFLPTLSYFIAKRLQYTTSTLKQILLFFAALGLYLSVTAIAEHLHLTGLIFPQYILDFTVGTHQGRSRGPFVDTIGNGGMLLLSFLSVSCIATSLTGFRRLLAFLLTFLILPAVYFTDTRAVWLGLGVIIATFLILRTPLRRMSALVVGLLVVVFLAGVGSKFSLSERTLFSRRQNTVDSRFDTFQIAWDAFKAHPLVGLGYGKLTIEWSNYFERSGSHLGVGMDDGNHNTLLGILADLGVTGAIPFLGVFACAVIVVCAAYRSLRDAQSIVERQFAVVAIGAVAVYFVLSLTNDLKAQPTINVSVFWLVGVISSVHSARLASKIDRTVGRDEPRVSAGFSARAARFGAEQSL